MPFLTEQDPRGKVKGSRDPLGFEVVWSTFGRRIIRNLTTITSSLESFATSLLGHYLANEFAEPGAGQDAVCQNFIRFEQIAAYSLLRYEELHEEYTPSILGILRARQRYREKTPPTIGADQKWQILSNQRAYGTWGLYTTVLRQTGFLEPGSHAVSAEGRHVCEKFLFSGLSPFSNELRHLVVSGGTFAPTRKNEKMALAVAEAILRRDALVVGAFYLPIAIGGKSGDAECQQNLYGFLCDENIRPLQTREVVDEALKRLDQTTALHGYLTDCRNVEKVLSCSQAIFGFLLTRDDAKIEDVVKDIEKKGYDFSFLRDALSSQRIQTINSVTGEVETGRRLDEIQRMLHGGDIVNAVHNLLALNEKVMRFRGGDGWARVEQGRLKVKYPYENSDLPETDEISTLWYNSYFLDSLRNLASSLTT